MVTTKDSTLIEIPAALRDLIARRKRHPRQAFHEVIEEAFFFWEEAGGWDYTPAGQPGGEWS